MMFAFRRIDPPLVDYILLWNFYFSLSYIINYSLIMLVSWFVSYFVYDIFFFFFIGAIRIFAMYDFTVLLMKKWIQVNQIK